VLHFENRTLHLPKMIDMETKLDNTTEPQHDAKLPVGSSASFEPSDEWVNGELCEPEGCEFCDMDGSWKNGFHLIGCPNGMMS
jgi:hypothetical protein